jgi:hypothetical protein
MFKRKFNHIYLCCEQNGTSDGKKVGKKGKKNTTYCLHSYNHRKCAMECEKREMFFIRNENGRLRFYVNFPIPLSIEFIFSI